MRLVNNNQIPPLLTNPLADLFLFCIIERSNNLCGPLPRIHKLLLVNSREDDLEWFTELLQQAGLRPAEHLLIMTLPSSYLDRFAHEQQAPSLPLQLDRGTGTGTGFGFASNTREATPEAFASLLPRLTVPDR